MFCKQLFAEQEKDDSSSPLDADICSEEKCDVFCFFVFKGGVLMRK